MGSSYLRRLVIRFLIRRRRVGRLPSVIAGISLIDHRLIIRFLTRRCRACRLSSLIDGEILLHRRWIFRFLIRRCRAFRRPRLIAGIILLARRFRPLLICVRYMLIWFCFGSPSGLAQSSFRKCSSLSDARPFFD